MPYYALDFRVGNLTCQLITIQSGTYIPPTSATYYEHFHSYIELHYVENGSCEFICHKKVFKVNPGQVLIIPPRMYHREIRTSENIKKMSILIDISCPEKACSDADLLFYQSFLSDEAILVSSDNSELTETLRRMRALSSYTQAQYIENEKLRALCNLFLIDLFELTLNGNKIKNEKPTSPSFSEEYIIDTFSAHKYKPASSISELAKTLHISERQLNRTIKQKYNMNYRDKMKEQRVEIATGFLCGTDKSICEISELLGYNNTSAFSAFIKNATGKTPTQIRKENLNR